MAITFGTDGWRAILDKDFTRENVERVTIAIGKYVAETFGFKKLLIVGYDPRRMAKEYARECAEILAKNGFKVQLSSRVLPTPVLAFQAKERNACAVMFTASHNPPDYLGMKFIPDYAGPATSEITDKIVSNIDKGINEGGKVGQLEEVDFAPEYYQYIEKLIDFEKIKNLKTNIIFDGFYSASIGYFDELLRRSGVEFQSLRMEHDTNFGGGMPDPKPKYLAPLIEKVKSTPNSIGLANDGDADRFGVINEYGEYVSPNIVIAILLKHLLSKGYKGSVVKTVGSSLVIDRIAEKLGVDVIETPVGFKHVGEAMRLNDVIIGGEESGGLSIKGHIPEKDGLLANLLVLEAMGASGKSLVDLEKEIQELGGVFYNSRDDYEIENPKEVTASFKGVKKLGEFEVTETDLKDGVKLMFGSKTKVLIRPSGTEPLLRVYFESDDRGKIRDLSEQIKKYIPHR